ncbi:MAG: hypothetical protein WB765_12730 [Acidimicrobiales bacterium]
MSTSNHASHSNNTLVMIDAGMASRRPLHSAHAVVDKQPSRMTSNPVQASGQLSTR